MELLVFVVIILVYLGATAWDSCQRDAFRTRHGSDKGVAEADALHAGWTTTL